MKTIRFENLINAKDSEYGKAGEVITIQVEDDFDDTQMKKAGEYGKTFAERIKKVAEFNNLPQLNSR